MSIRCYLVLLLVTLIFADTINGQNSKSSLETGHLICIRGTKKNGGSVILKDGKKILWEFSGLTSPRFAEQLPNGNILICEYGYDPYPEKLQVTERTPQNKIVWKHVAYDPVACFRLKDGRTVIVAEREVYLVNDEGERIRSLYRSNRNLVRGGGLLPDQTVGIFRSANENSLLIEVDLNGKQIRETELIGGGATGILETLPNGHLLIPMTYRNKVIELDVNRKPVSTFAAIQQPIGVQRLPGGNIFVTTYNAGCVIFDPEGKKLSTQSHGRVTSVRVCTASDSFDGVTRMTSETRSLICDMTSVYLAQNGQRKWAIEKLRMPYAELMPNGNVLIAEKSGASNRNKPVDRVTERTPQGKVVKTIHRGPASFCTAIDAGRIAMVVDDKLVVVDRVGNSKTLFEAAGQRVRGASKLPNGGLGILVRQSYKKHSKTLLVEYDSTGKKIRDSELDGVALGNFAALPNGNLLVPITFVVPNDIHKFGQVVELDRNRKVAKVFAKLPEPIAVQRAPNGDIWVTSRELGIVVFSGTGRRLSVRSVSDVFHAQHYFPNLEGPKGLRSTSQSQRMKRFRLDRSAAAIWLAQLGARIDRDEKLPGNPVTAIDLYSYYGDQSRVTDEVLEVIRLFDKLKWLNVANSKISDRGLQFLSKLNKLERLVLDSTSITDKGLQSLSPIKSLRHLHLADLDIGNKGLEVVVDSNPNLESLIITGTRVDNQFASNLVGLSKLKTLVLPSGITDEGLNEISRIGSLEKLVTAGVGITDRGVKNLSSLEKLNSIGLEGAKISDAGLVALTRLKEVRELDVSGAPNLTPLGLGEIAKFRKLRVLRLSNTKLDDDALARISNLGYLEELHLQGTEITDKGLDYLSNTISLRFVYLSGTPVSSEAIERLKFELPYCRIYLRDPG